MTRPTFDLPDVRPRVIEGQGRFMFELKFELIFAFTEVGRYLDATLEAVAVAMPATAVLPKRFPPEDTGAALIKEAVLPTGLISGAES